MLGLGFGRYGKLRNQLGSFTGTITKGLTAYVVIRGLLDWQTNEQALVPTLFSTLTNLVDETACIAFGFVGEFLDAWDEALAAEPDWYSEPFPLNWLPKNWEPGTVYLGGVAQ